MSEPITSKKKQIPLPLTQLEISCLWCQLIICLFCSCLFPLPNEAFLFKKTIHSSLSHPFSLFSWWSSLFCCSVKSFFIPFHPYLALFSFLQHAQGSAIPPPLHAVSVITHQGSRTNCCQYMKDSFASQWAGIHTWSYSRSCSNVTAPGHQGECAAHAEVSHQHEAQHQLFNRHLNLVLI